MFKIKKKEIGKDQEIVESNKDVDGEKTGLDGVLLPDLSTETYVHTTKALHKKKRNVQTILNQAEFMIEKETKLGDQ